MLEENEEGKKISGGVEAVIKRARISSKRHTQGAEC